MSILEFLDRLAGNWLMWRQDRLIKQNKDLSLEFKRAHFTPEGMEIVATCPGIIALADEAAAILNKRNAENYFQIDMLPRLDRGMRPIRLTIQWAGKLSPAQKADHMEANWIHLSDRVRNLVEHLKAYDGYTGDEAIIVDVIEGCAKAAK